MKLEAGKFYKTRSGSTAFVASIACPFEGELPYNHYAIGWAIVGDEPEALSWSCKGRFMTGNGELPLDLVEEIAAPRVAA